MERILASIELLIWFALYKFIAWSQEKTEPPQMGYGITQTEMI
jgi:hypothetical protein